VTAELSKSPIRRRLKSAAMLLVTISVLGVTISGTFWMNSFERKIIATEKQSSELAQSIKQIDDRTFNIEKQFSDFSSPSLHCSVVQGAILQSYQGSVPRIIYKLKVVNSGSPSIAWRWHLVVTLTTGQNIDVDASENPASETVVNPPPNGPSIFDNSNYLPNTLLENPIATGAGKAGWVGFEMNTATADDLVRIGNQLVLSFEDCKGNVISITNVLTKAGGQF